MASREQQPMTPERQCKAKPTDRGEAFPMPGDRVLAFDHLLYRDDVSTPCSVTVRPATVLARYGTESKRFGRYPDLVDLLFDHRPEQSSYGHFTHGVRRLTSAPGCQRGVRGTE